jgi:hypothetical protein
VIPRGRGAWTTPAVRGDDVRLVALDERWADDVTALLADSDVADAALAQAAETVPAIFLSEERLAQHLRVGERDWVAAFADELHSGGLAWPRRRARPAAPPAGSPAGSRHRVSAARALRERPIGVEER